MIRDPISIFFFFFYQEFEVGMLGFKC